MEEKEIKQQGQAQQVAPVMLMPQVMTEGEINLLDLWHILVSRWRLIFAITGITLAVALAYALLATPIYKAEAYLLPPQNKDVQSLNVQGLSTKESNKELYTPENVYELYILYLKSRALRRKFFDENGILQQLDPEAKASNEVEQVFEEGFNKALSIHRDQQDKAIVSVVFEGRDAALAAGWINAFLVRVHEFTVEGLAGGVLQRIANDKRNLEEAVAGKRTLAKQRRLDRIAQLRESLIIAEQLGIRENGLAFASKQQGAVAVNFLDPPVYMMGTKAIKAELETLQARTSDDPFTPGLRDLEEQLASLEGVRIDKDSIKVATFDQLAVPPARPFKPKRKLIVLLALFGGLLLGVFAAFFTEFIEKAKLRDKESAFIGDSNVGE